MRNRIGNCLVGGGLLLFAAAFSLFGHNIYEEHRAGRFSDRICEEMSCVLENREYIGLDQEALSECIEGSDMEMPVTEIDGNEYIGILEIPSLKLSLPVMSSWSYEKLKLSPCRYRGSAYNDTLIILGHNYNTHFGKLKLLKEGDRITFTDLSGDRFFYTVTVTETLERTAVEEMEAGEWDLTLFTCTIGGESRVTVRAERTE